MSTDIEVNKGKMEYIKQHKIHLLFEQLADKLLSTKPGDPVQFLLDNLLQLKVEQAKANGTATSKPSATSSTSVTTSTTATATTAAATDAKKKEELLKVTLAVFGLDAAGKSTLISAISGEVDKNCAPTVGFSPNHFRSEAWDLMLFDLGGGAQFRSIWKEYYSELHGVIFVVDSANASRFNEAKEVLHGIVADSRAMGKPLLIFANKQDVSTAKTAREVEKALAVASVERHHVFGCSAIAEPMDPNIDKGLEWLLEEVTKSFDDLSLRVKKQLAEDKQRRSQAMVEQQKRVAEYRKEWDAADAKAKEAAEEAAAAPAHK